MLGHRALLLALLLGWASVSGLVVNGIAIPDAQDDNSTHVVVVEETGTADDVSGGLCLEFGDPAVPLRALLTCSLHGAVGYVNALPRDDSAFILLAPGHYYLTQPLPKLVHSVTLVGGTRAYLSQPVFPLVRARIESGDVAVPHTAGGGAIGADRPVIDGSSRFRALELGANLFVSIRHVSIVNGYGYRGGGILQAPAGTGWTRLDDVRIESCSAAYGGGIYSASRMEIARSELSANAASVCGAAIYALPKTLSAKTSTLTNNRDKCERKPDSLHVYEMVKGEGSDVAVIIVGSHVEHDARAWAAEDKRIRDERQKRRSMLAEWAVTGRPRPSAPRGTISRRL
jgi:hypothetical protein